MSIKLTIVLSAAIVLSSAGLAAAQVYGPQVYDYDPGFGGGGGYRSFAAPPSFWDYPATAGGGSVGYNQNLRRDDW